MIVEATSDWDLSQRLPVKREPAEVPHERHGRNSAHAWPGGCQQPRNPCTVAGFAGIQKLHL
jgi:hypothetical protein